MIRGSKSSEREGITNSTVDLRLSNQFQALVARIAVDGWNEVS